MGTIRSDKLAAGSLGASATIYTAPTDTRAKLAVLRLQFVTAPAGTYTVNLVTPAVTLRILTLVNPAVGLLQELILEDRLSAGDSVQIGVVSASVVRYWLSGTTYVD